MHTIAIPDPLSGSASGCASTGTGTPNTGVSTEDPNRDWYRASSGCATSATQAGSSSGRVVSIHTGDPSAARKEIRWNAPATSRSSSSACATAVWKVTSHSVGASARYASPRERLRRNARCDTRRAASLIVV